MDDEQARFLLGACQPSGSDAGRPEVADAFAQARRDPGLAAWLARERRSDLAIARKLRAIEPPAALRARILAGARASRRRPVWQRWRITLAAAAVLALAAGIAWLAPKWTHARPEALPPLVEWKQSNVSLFTDPNYRLDLMHPEYESLEAHLLAAGAPVAGALPFNDSILRAAGCKVLHWNGHMVSLTCFFTASGQLVHLFVIPRGTVDESLIRNGAHREQLGMYATLTWMRGDRVLMVASTLPAAGLEQVLDRSAAGMLASFTRRAPGPGA